MMQITIKNQIQQADEMEQIVERHDGELTIKGDYHYLIYQNESDEKVILKFNQAELVMTRFSKPQSIMRFVANDLALCSLPTPVGVQKLVTKTSCFEMLSGELSLAYELLPYAEADEALASYQLSISWE